MRLPDLLSRSQPTASGGRTAGALGRRVTVVPKPNRDEFWTFFEAVREKSTSDAQLPDAFTEELSRLPIPRIARFQRNLMELMEEALTWKLWDAADIIFQPWGASMDTFVYFRLWLIAQGRDTFERALREPDSLADHPFLQRFAAGAWENEDFPEMESLMYSAEGAFERVLEKLPPAIAARTEPPDELESRPREVPWEQRPPEEGRYPRLARLFEAASRHAYLRDLVAVLERYWGNVMGVYLHGSSVLGGWDPQRSDVDVLAVVAWPGVLEAQQELGEALAAVGPCPGTGLEMSVITAETAASLADFSFVVHVNTVEGKRVIVPGAGHAGDPDLLLHSAVCREHGVAVSGPPPDEVFGPVGRERILTAMGAEVSWGVENASAAYAVLNACRAARYAEDGTLCSKVEGGQWFLVRHPGHPIVTAALDPQAPQPTRDDVASFVAEHSLRL